MSTNKGIVVCGVFGLIVAILGIDPSPYIAASFVISALRRGDN